jgi:hypothetical protein
MGVRYEIYIQIKNKICSSLGLTYALHFIVGQSLHAYRWWLENRLQQQIEITSIDPIR